MWIRRFTVLAAMLCLVVVVLGAYVRLSNAGLGCPDWPGCYGHVTPAAALRNAEQVARDYPGLNIETGKAWREMIHRYAASTLGLLIVIITALAWQDRRRRSMAFHFTLLGTVVAQGVLGMLTVTWLLKPLIVTLHLLGGLSTLGLLLWLMLGELGGGSVTLPPSGSDRMALRMLRRAAAVALAVLALQIALGGWTSSNYAAMACPDVPRCQNAWWPPMDLGDAFVLWRGLDINYEGGVLDHPARVAIHFMHRLGAILATLVLTATALLAWRQRRHSARLTRAAVLVGVLLATQLTIGISMVRKAFPLDIATLHNAGAALLLVATIYLLHAARYPQGRNP